MPFTTARKDALCRAFAFTALAALCLFAAAMALSGCAALDKAAPEFAGSPATTQPASPATARNVPAQIATVVLPVTQNPAVQAVAAAVPFAPAALSILGIVAALVIGSAHKTQTSAATTRAAIAALGDAASAAVPALPPGTAQTIAGDTAAVAGAVAGAIAAGAPAAK